MVRELLQSNEVQLLASECYSVGQQTNPPLYLGRDGAALVEPGEAPLRMIEINNFQVLDPYPAPADFDPASADLL